MAAYRMYNAVRARFKITLVHGNPEQETYDLFKKQVFLTPGRTRWQQIGAMRRSAQWLDRHADQFDVFHGTQGYHVTARSAFIAHQLGLPAVITIASHRGDLADKGGVKRLLGLPQRRREMVKRIAAIIATSQAIERELVDYGVPVSKIARIPYGVDTSQFHPPTDEAQRLQLREQFEWPQRPTIVFSGVMDERKRPHLLIEAMPLIKARGGSCHLVFAGPFKDPTYAKRLKASVAQERVADDVTFLGFTRNIADVYRAADVFALPSRQEGLPNAMLEALATGLPSIATRISGVTDLVEDGANGILIEPTADEMAEAILVYLRQPQLCRKHGAVGCQRVIQTCSATAVGAAHERLFRRIMAGGDAAGS